MPDWLVARSAPNVETSLEARIQRLGTEVYVARYRRDLQDKRTHRQRSIVRPLFPSYLFVRSPQHHYLAELDGCIGIVMHGGEPARSERLDADVERLRREAVNGLTSVAEPQKPQMPQFAVGQTVRITSGPFEGQTATVTKLGRNKRVQILIKWLGRELQVWYRPQDLGDARTNNTLPLVPSRRP